MDAVKIGAEVSKARNCVVFWGHQSTDPKKSALFQTLTSLSYEITTEDGIVVTSRFPAVDVPKGGIPPATEVDDAEDLVDAEIYPGLYAAEFSVPETYDDGGGAIPQAPGRYLVEWTWETEDESGVGITSFQLVSTSYPLVRGYLQIADAEAEGVVVDDTEPYATGSITSQNLKRSLEIACDFVEKYTGIDFGIYTRTLNLSPRGKKTLWLGQACIGVSSVEEYGGWDHPLLGEIYSTLYPSEYVVPNNHIRYETYQPDDRKYPVLRRKQHQKFSCEPGAFVLVKGVFGWTHRDGVTDWGRIPRDIVRATVLIALRNLDSAATSASDTAVVIRKEKTWDQEIAYDTTKDAINFINFASDGKLSVRSILDQYRGLIHVGGV